MKQPVAYLLPKFDKVEFFRISDSDSYETFFKSASLKKTALLIDEKECLWEFIDEINKKIGNFNFYDFYPAYNIQFKPVTVKLMTKSGGTSVGIKDFLELLNILLKSPRGKYCAVLIRSDPSNNFSYEELFATKLKILQQFIFLRMYLPVEIANSPEEVVNKIFKNPNYKKPVDVGIFGTKKAGKSSLINALLGAEYSPMSLTIPTPNNIFYSSAPSDEKIKLTYGNTSKLFDDAESLNEYMKETFKEANKNSTGLDDMSISISGFPKNLSPYRLIDTPGPNFAGSKEHSSITQKAISAVNFFIFVTHYSQEFTEDEENLLKSVFRQRQNNRSRSPVIVVINKVDKIYDDTDANSYERLADYVQKRITSMGFKNFLVIPVSALQEVYAKNFQKLLASDNFANALIESLQNLKSDDDNIESSGKKFIPGILVDFASKLLEKSTGNFIERLEKLKKKYHGKEQLTVIKEIEKAVTNFEDFHGIEIESISEIQRSSRIYFLKYLIGWCFGT